MTDRISVLFEKHVPIILYGAQGQRAARVMAKMTPEGVLEMWAHQIYLDSNNVEIHGRTDDYGLVRNRPYEPLRRVASVALTGAYVTHYTAPANSVVRVHVQLGTLTSDDMEASIRVQGTIQIAQIPVYFGAPGPKFTFVIEGAEIVEGVRTAGAGGVITIDAEVFSTGDEHTGV